MAAAHNEAAIHIRAVFITTPFVCPRKEKILGGIVKDSGPPSRDERSFLRINLRWPLRLRLGRGLRGAWRGFGLKHRGLGFHVRHVAFQLAGAALQPHFAELTDGFEGGPNQEREDHADQGGKEHYREKGGVMFVPYPELYGLVYVLENEDQNGQRQQPEDREFGPELDLKPKVFHECLVGAIVRQSRTYIPVMS